MIIGIDVGGTNIDGVVIDDGQLIQSVKHQVNRSQYFASIWQCLQDLLQKIDKAGISRIHLSTTVCTNAIVEDQVSAVGLILQTGPGLNWTFERLGDHLATVSGSVDHRGKLVRDLDLQELAEIRSRFRESPLEALAVITKFSTRNPEFEQRIRDYFAPDYQEITLGHSLSGKLNFPRRVQTAYLNAAVSKIFRGFATQMQQALQQEKILAPVYILKADGGTIDLDGALKKPVETILSGPAASFMGMMALSDLTQSDRVLLDIGGTTTDIFFLVDGVPVFEPLGIAIDGRKTLVRAIYSTSIGLGGDSEVRIEESELCIGPRRLGRAVTFGGSRLTPTDALVYLGALTGDFPAKSREALEQMAQAHGLAPDKLAQDIVQQFCATIAKTIQHVLHQLNASPVYTIKELLRDRAIKPQAVEVIGGPAQVLAPHLEKALKLPVHYPRQHDVANAIGAALAKPTVEINMLADTERKMLTVPELDIYEKIDRSYDLRRATEQALAYVRQAGHDMGLADDQIEAEIVEAESFNMVQGFYGVDRNIRVKAQIKPGLLGRLRQPGPA